MEPEVEYFELPESVRRAMKKAAERRRRQERLHFCWELVLFLAVAVTVFLAIYAQSLLIAASSTTWLIRSCHRRHRLRGHVAGPSQRNEANG